MAARPGSLGDDDPEEAYKKLLAANSSLSVALALIHLTSSPVNCVQASMKLVESLGKQMAQQTTTDSKLRLITVMRQLLFNAKSVLNQNNAGSMPMLDNLLAHTELLLSIVKARPWVSLALEDFESEKQCRMLRDTLVNEGFVQLALDVATKCHIEAEPVWAKWGITLLKERQFREAREKFKFCLVPLEQTSQRGGGPSLYTLNLVKQIVEAIEPPPPKQVEAFINNERMPLQTNEASMGYWTVIFNHRQAQLRKEAEAGGAAPSGAAAPAAAVDPSADASVEARNAAIEECIFYLETYGQSGDIVAFFMRQGMITEACRTVLEKNISTAIFVSHILDPCVAANSLTALHGCLAELDPTLKVWSEYLTSMCRSLYKRKLNQYLYEVQVFMKDYVRAGLTCVNLFIESTGAEVTRITYLQQAAEHFRKAAQEEEEALARGEVPGGARPSAVSPVTVEDAGDRPSGISPTDRLAWQRRESRLRRAQSELGGADEQQTPPTERAATARRRTSESGAAAEDSAMRARLNSETESGRQRSDASTRPAGLSQSIAAANAAAASATPRSAAEYLARVTLQLEALNTIPGAKFTIFGKTQEKCQVVEEVLYRADNMDLAWRIITLFSLGYQRIFTNYAKRLLSEERMDRAENLFRMTRNTLTDAEWDEMLHECVLLLASREGAKGIDKLIGFMTSDTNKITAFLACKKLMSAYLIAVKLNSVRDIVRIRDVAGEQPKVFDLCEKFLAAK